MQKITLKIQFMEGQSVDCYLKCWSCWHLKKIAICKAADDAYSSKIYIILFATVGESY